MKPFQGTVVIPAAVPVNTALAADFGNISPIRLPTRGVSLGARLWQAYSPSTSDIRFVLSSPEEQVVRSGGVLGLPSSVNIFPVNETLSLAHSILAAFTDAPSGCGRIVVNFGDTFIPRRVSGEDRVVVAYAESLVRWTTLTQSRPGTWQITEKNRLKPASLTHWIVTGVFDILDGEAFLETLRQSTRAPVDDIDPFFVALMQYLQRFGPIDSDVVFENQTDSWLDFGHVDSLHSSRLALDGASRSFNVVKVDPVKGLVTKQSNRSSEFAAERMWYFSLGDSLRHIAPRVLSNKSDDHLTLEYYGYPSLQDLFLHSSLDLGDWDVILRKLGNALAALSQAVSEPGVDPRTCALARLEMYYEKTSQRMEEGFRQTHLAKAWQVPRINGSVCPTGIEIVERLKDDLNFAGLLAPNRVGVIHGDFCLSNILYDRRSGIVRLIDPRGLFGSIFLYGDPLYDEAKLRHSFHGYYDFLVHGLVDVSIGNDSLGLAVPVTKLQIEIRELFESWQQDRLGDTIAAVGLIEAILFLSMVPLHADRPDAQIAFTIRGRQLYAKAIKAAE